MVNLVDYLRSMNRFRGKVNLVDYLARVALARHSSSFGRSGKSRNPSTAP
jgi:hypothetical protein